MTATEQKKTDRIVYLCIQMIRESRKEGLTDQGLKIERAGGLAKIEDVPFMTDEEIRVGWGTMPSKRKLCAEEPGLDIEVLYDNIIIRPFDTKAFCRTKLQLPDGAMAKTRDLYSLFKHMPLQGLVVAVGPGWLTDSGALRPVSVKVGDHVVVRHAISVADFIYNDRVYYDMKASSISAIMPEKYTDSISGLKFDESKTN